MSFYSSFVLRIWVDDSGEMTRGQIQHVNTQESIYFVNSDKMLAFIRNHLNPPLRDLVEPSEGPPLHLLVQQGDNSDE